MLKVFDNIDIQCVLMSCQEYIRAALNNHDDLSLSEKEVILLINDPGLLNQKEGTGSFL